MLVVRLEGLLGGVDRRQRQSEVTEAYDDPGEHGERVGEQERPTGGELVTDELQQRLALEAVVEADVAGGVGRERLVHPVVFELEGVFEPLHAGEVIAVGVVVVGREEVGAEGGGRDAHRLCERQRLTHRGTGQTERLDPAVEAVARCLS